MCIYIYVYIYIRFTLHTTLYTSHLTLHTPHSTLHTPHSELYTRHSTLYISHSAHYTLHSTLHLTPHAPTLYTLHFTLHTLDFTCHTVHCTLYTVRSTLRFTIHTLHFPVRILHFTFYTFTLHPHNFTLFTLDSVWNLGLASFSCCAPTPTSRPQLRLCTALLLPALPKVHSDAEGGPFHLPQSLDNGAWMHVQPSLAFVPTLSGTVTKFWYYKNNAYSQTVMRERATGKMVFLHMKMCRE